ncbi:MAG: glycosyltransferase [Clostridia bacterium]|nr:glycosyltransferase [Clostridia bacterium]
MKKIVFGITGLTLGGAERVLVDIANKLSKEKKCKITIFTIYAKGELEKQLNDEVELKSIYNKQYKELTKIQRKLIIPIKILLEKRKIYKKYIKNKYDVEVAFLEGPVTRIFAQGKEKEKKIAWIHNDITKVYGTGMKAKIKRNIDENIYKKFKKLVFVSKDNLEQFEKQYKNESEKAVIYNYIDSNRIIEKSKEGQAEEIIKGKEINIVTVARLVEQKGIDRLIKVHSKLIKEGKKHNIYVIGEGPERTRLEEIIQKEQCQETIKLLGAKENPYPYIKKSDYFALLSNYEGYPMVLLEAQILGKYILITDTAAKETIKEYEESKIFENTEQGIYKGLKEVLENTDNIKKAEKSKEYNNEQIIKKVEQLIGITI